MSGLGWGWWVCYGLGLVGSDDGEPRVSFGDRLETCCLSDVCNHQDYVCYQAYAVQALGSSVVSMTYALIRLLYLIICWAFSWVYA